MAGALDARGVIVACPQCGRSNRLLFASLDKPTRCGHCKTMLQAAPAPMEATSGATFRAAAAASALPLIVDFWAPWCGPCRMVAPELERVARNTAGRYLVVKVNTDQLTDIAAEFRIQSIPTLAVVHRGQEIARIAGARSAADIEAFAHQAVESQRRRAS